jgi:pimeloyl-ACP methyl ester carboxylesterase
MSQLLPKLHTDEKEISILGWPTDTVSVEHENDNPHTILVFIPGNPGCIGWYTPNLVELVSRLGRGYAARGISYAGHGLNDRITNVEQWIGSKERDTTIPWTVDGQIRHKMAYLDTLLAELQEARRHIDNCQFIFLGHSIGCHMIQRMLILRPDILERTSIFLQLMPFTRMKAPKFMDMVLKTAAGSPHMLIGVSQQLLHILKRMPIGWVDDMMKSTIQDKTGRELAVHLLRQPHFARNFFELGTEEIRDLPDVPDVRVG